MRKIIGSLLSIVMVLSIFRIVFCANTDNATELIMRLNSSKMDVNGVEVNIDDNGTVPLVVEGRTLIPIRAMIEVLGGNVDWNSKTQTATLKHNNNEIRLTVNNNIAYVNNEAKALDTVPVIINGRIMLPVRFVAENFDFDVNWNETDKTITIIKKEQNEIKETENKTSSNKLVVYFAYSENIGDTSTMDIDTITSASLNAHTDNINGNIQLMANEIKNRTNSDIYSVVITEPYDPDYNKMVSRASEELKNNIKPVLATTIDDFDKYDTVFIGTPVWFGKLPPAMESFFEKYDLSKKIVIPFGIHLGSGWGSNVSDIKQKFPDTELIEGITVNADTANNDVKIQVNKWLDTILK